MPRRPAKELVTFRAERVDKEDLDEIIAADGVSASAVLRKALREYVRRWRRRQKKTQESN